ncbi:hypothetical protein TL16_g02520 [Triparma laevis f. inornata]|uniref:Kinesin light chain n=1 Tax=Triparma laevis f. inornata TaxID=1714386 RepID=A0A9W6ZU00_9STRA|nr:hypothetical protein TL16_g02520 [Triparma laevis f. inornata]
MAFDCGVGRILEILELAMPEEKKVRGKKKKQQKKKNPRKLEILDSCFALGGACQEVRDFEEVGLYSKRAKEGYEEQLGRNNEKTLEATRDLICGAPISTDERVEKLSDLVKRMERALGEENVVTLNMLNNLGNVLDEKEEYEESRKVYERCLAGRMKVLGEDHKNNLGVVNHSLRNGKKALEYYMRALKGYEKLSGKNHSDTLDSVNNIAILFYIYRQYPKAEELYERALGGREAQLGKDHKLTKECANNFMCCLKESGKRPKWLIQLISNYPWLKNE